MVVISSSPQRAFLSPPRPQTLPFWARIETLWLLFVPLCALVYALLQPLAPNDLWYHVRAGELLAQTGHIPTTNAMSSGVPLDTPFYYQSWLAEAALYQTLIHFGLGGLQWLRALCLCGAFGILMWAGLRWAKRDELAFGSSAARSGGGRFVGVFDFVQQRGLAPANLFCSSVRDLGGASARIVARTFLEDRRGIGCRRGTLGEHARRLCPRARVGFRFEPGSRIFGACEAILDRGGRRVSGDVAQPARVRFV